MLASWAVHGWLLVSRHFTHYLSQVSSDDKAEAAFYADLSHRFDNKDPKLMAAWTHLTDSKSPVTYSEDGDCVLDGRNSRDVMDALREFYPEHLFPRLYTAVCDNHSIDAKVTNLFMF
jgi:hypothetical protein